jgi:hypothetical protein
MQIAACTSFSTAISSEGMPTAATEIDFFCGHWLTSAEHRGMSASGQKAEYSSRADVFCCGPDNGHPSIGSASPFGTNSCHEQMQQLHYKTRPY